MIFIERVLRSDLGPGTFRSIVECSFFAIKSKRKYYDGKLENENRKRN